MFHSKVIFNSSHLDKSNGIPESEFCEGNSNKHTCFIF